MVDSLTVPTGALTPIRSNSKTVDVAAPPAGGREVQLTSFDDPEFGWDALHPTTLNPWATTAGSNAFQEFVVAFSSSFPVTYLQLHSANWSVAAVGGNTAGNWVNTVSSVCCTGTLQAIPAGVLVQVLGPNFTSNILIKHVP